MRKILLAQIIFLFFGCGDPAGENAYKINKVVEICSPAGITAEALLKAGKVAEEEYILPNGRRLTPAGDLIALGQFPLGLALDQSEKFAYIVPNDDKNNSLVVIDLNEKKIIQTVKGMRTFRGVAVSPDNQYLYVGGASSGTLHRFTIGQTGEVSDQKNYFLGGYIAALAIPPDGGYIYAVSNTNSKVFKFSAADEEVVSVFKAGQFPYDAVLSKDGKKLFISNLAAGTVLGLDTESGNALFEIKVGKNPQVMVLNKSGALLFVANSDSDTVSVIDLAQEKVVNTIDLTGNPFFFKAGSVNGLAVTADDKYLLATHAMMNKIEIVDLADFKPKGDIPAGWYPTEVKVTKEGGEILALSSKGFGSIGDLDNIPGFLQIIAFPDDAALAAYSATVKANNERAEKFFEEICSPETIPALSGKDSPIKHVVLIVRENKTYDMVLGDFERGDGDPSLTLFGKDITKNLHKIAEEFVNMDNFYSNPENSLQGHLWTTQATCNDYVEKLKRDQLPIAGYEPASLPEDGTVFDHLYKHGVSFRNYGEFASFGAYMLEEKFAPFLNKKFPFYNLEIKDVLKAQEFVREMKLGIFPQFVYIALPNDHTYGTKPGKPTPDSMVADNDMATGIIVEAISKSQYWDKTIIFLIEDDPQSWKGDHVEAHRSICLVVSPYVKRKYTSSVHYDIPSIYRTIMMILGIPPMNKNDALAAPMADIFVKGTPEDKPDFTPYEAIPVDIPEELNTESSPMASESAKLDFNRPDGVEGLGYILWRAKKGDAEPPPYAKGIDR